MRASLSSTTSLAMDRAVVELRNLDRDRDRVLPVHDIDRVLQVGHVTTCQLSTLTCLLSSVICHLKHVIYQLRQAPLSPVTFHLSPDRSTTCRLSSVACHLLTVTCRLSPVAYHLSSVTCQMSPVPCHLHLSPVTLTCHLSPGRSTTWPCPPPAWRRCTPGSGTRRPGGG